MTLTPEEVSYVLRLLRESDFDTLEYESNGLRLVAHRAGSLAPRQPQSNAASDLEREDDAAAADLAVTLPIPDDATLATPSPPDAQEPSHLQRVVKAPMVGTFYRAPDPGAEPFVKVGDVISSETTVGLIEVMKMFTAIKAEVEGRVEKVLVDDGAFVEYGEALFVLVDAA